MSTTKKVSKDLINLRLDKATSVLFEEFSRTKLKEWILSGEDELGPNVAIIFVFLFLNIRLSYNILTNQTCF